MRHPFAIWRFRIVKWTGFPLTRLLLGGLFLSACAPGCQSVNSASMSARRTDIETRHQVDLDMSRSTPLLGDTSTTLKRIEKALEPFPKGYTAKMARINVVEDHFERWGLLAPMIGAYTEAGRPEQYGQIFIKNKSALEDVLGLFSGDTGLHLEHEGWHSVEYFEVQEIESFVRTRARNNPGNIFQVLSTTDVILANASPEELVELKRSGRSTPYVDLVRGWLFCSFGDVNDDGVIDDADVAYVDAHRDAFDADGDGRVTYADVAVRTGREYLWAYDPMDFRLQVGLTASLVANLHDAGFVSFHAQNFPWEDRAETVSFLADRGLVPHLYRRTTDARAARAWKEFNRIRRRDPLLARKLQLMIRYIASHEECQLMEANWQSHMQVVRSKG